jgi:hypothetical protein
VVARRLERADRLAVGHREDGDLLADQAFLEHEPPAGIAELVADHDPLDRVERLVLVLRDDHALARREPVGLEHAGPGGLLLGDPQLGVARIVEDPIVRARDVVLAQEVLGEDLAAFELRGRLARPEELEPVRREPIGDPEHERRLRPDDREVDLRLAGVARERLDVVGRDVDAGRDLRERVVARRDEEATRERRGEDRLGQRVLATAGADEEDVQAGHRSALSISRKGARTLAFARSPATRDGIERRRCADVAALARRPLR